MCPDSRSASWARGPLGSRLRPAFIPPRLQVLLPWSSLNSVAAPNVGPVFRPKSVLDSSATQTVRVGMAPGPV